MNSWVHSEAILSRTVAAVLQRRLCIPSFVTPLALSTLMVLTTSVISVATQRRQAAMLLVACCIAPMVSKT